MLIDDVIVYLKLCASYPYLVMMSLFICMGYSSPPSSPPQFSYLTHSQIFNFAPSTNTTFLFLYTVKKAELTELKILSKSLHP